MGPMFTPPVVSKQEGPIALLTRALAGTNWKGGSFDPETHVACVYSTGAIGSMGLVPPPAGFSDMRYISGNVLTGARLTGGSGSAAGEDDRVAGGAATSAEAAGAEGGGGGGLTVRGLPLGKPPYGRITAIDLDKGEIKWQIAHGETPDNVKNNPALKGLTHSSHRAGRHGRDACHQDAGHLWRASCGNDVDRAAWRDAAGVRQVDGRGSRRRLHACAGERRADDIHVRRQAVSSWRSAEERTGRAARTQVAGLKDASLGGPDEERQSLLAPCASSRPAGDAAFPSFMRQGLAALCIEGDDDHRGSGSFRPASSPAPSGGRGATLKDVPEFCRVSATIQPTSDSDIKVEVWLPATDWNGKFQAVRNGRLGRSDRAIPQWLTRASRGVRERIDGHWPCWGPWDPLRSIILRKLIDFAWRSEHEMTVKAKAIIRKFYGRAPRLSYWNGRCSTGGRTGPQGSAEISGRLRWHHRRSAGQPDGHLLVDRRTPC